VIVWEISKLSSHPQGNHQLTRCNSLAYAELYILTAVMSRPGGLNMSLFETHLSDIKPVHHLAGSIPKMDSNGLRIKVQ
jgi:hypothetical protein